MKKILGLLLAFVYAVMPANASAQNYNEITGYFSGVTNIISTILLPLVFSLALLVFVWGMFRFFIYGGHEPDEQKKGKELMIWATVAFVLMVSIWGVVNLATSVLDLDSKNNAPALPSVPGSTD